MREKLEASIYITVDTLKYLKKGGRVTPAAAAIGSVLNLKPVLTIQGEKLDSFSKLKRMEEREEDDVGCNGKGSDRAVCRTGDVSAGCVYLFGRRSRRMESRSGK